MKKIICELCEGTVFDKVDGRFVCKGCGTSYSAEEVRGMMREVEGEEATTVETPSPSMPRVNPGQQQLDNILMLAISSYEADNNSEAENYCNQAIVIDATCYKAWFLKGKAIGWQSTLGNNRIEEAAHSFCKAIDFAPEDEKEDLKFQASEELKKLGLACIYLRKENFMNDPDTSELEGFKNDQLALLNALTVLLDYGNVVGIPDGYLEEVATMMNEAAVGALDMVRSVWNRAEHPTDSDLATYLGWMGNIAALIRQAIDVSDDDEANITRYKNLAIVLEEPLDAHSDKSYWNSTWNEYRWTASKSLTTEARISRLTECRDVLAKAAALKKKVEDKKAAEEKKAEEEKKARLEEYWTDPEHAEEKAQLDKEKSELSDKVSALDKEIAKLTGQINAANRENEDATPSEAELSKVQDQIGELNNERATLGIFQGRRKKEVNDQIQILEARVSSLKEKAQNERESKNAEVNVKLMPVQSMKRELEAEVSKLQKRISEINKRLTEDPAEE